MTGTDLCVNKCK